MFCPRCGNEIKTGASFCGKCGKELKVAKKDTTPTTSVSPTIPVSTTQRNISQFNPSRAFSPRPTKVIKPKSQKSISSVLTKNNVITFFIFLALIACYIGIIIILTSLLNTGDAIIVDVDYKKDTIISITLKEYLDLLVVGNRLFNPTAISTAIGICVYLFIYGAPAFIVLNFIYLIFNKKVLSIHICSSIFSVISALISLLAIPLSLLLVADFKSALALRLCVLLEDISLLSYTKLIINAIIVIVLAILSAVIAIILNKRRSTK